MLQSGMATSTSLFSASGMQLLGGGLDGKKRFPLEGCIKGIGFARLESWSSLLAVLIPGRINACGFST